MDSKSEQKHSDSLFVETNTPVTLKANASNEKDQHEIESQKIANKQGEPHHPSISEEIVKSIKTKPDFKELQKSAKDLDKSSEDEEVLAKLSASEIQIPTPDDWVERSVQLQRLTGPFPLNAETPTSTLLKYGLFTPNSLHYVRNHGAVPKLDWETHTIEICGLVDKPLTLTMKNLEKLKPISIPVTLVCDGNRRKEVNTPKRSKGFNWGSGAVSTSVWTGVLLKDVLELVEIQEEKAKHVCFEGADKLAFGNYGTSIPLAIARDALSDVILAFKQNGVALLPDHGFPVRLVIPGYVGGRQVKWLSKIEISAEPTKNHYHYEDNRVLPPNVTIDTASQSGWFQKPETLLNELNVNSVIAFPQHEEWLTIDETVNKVYLIRGYAYAGGGRSIARVEVSFDGEEWETCQITNIAEEPRHGIKRWTWVFWHIEMPIWRFLRGDYLIVRAFDSSFNTQPTNITWNVLGMMNNAWYKLKIDIETSPHKPPSITFRHPVLPGSAPGGWMDAQRKSKQELTTAHSHHPQTLPSPVGSSLFVGKYFTTEEVLKHNLETDCWIIVDRKVYDVTPYLRDHPGGRLPIMMFAGKDASKEFVDVHAHDAFDILRWFEIGILIQDEITKPDSWRSKDAILNSRKWANTTLIAKQNLTPDTRLFRISLADKEGGNAIVGLPIGQHCLISCQIEGEMIVRPYTPVSPAFAEEDKGVLDFVIKIYEKGRLTNFLDTLEIGSKIRIKGPAGPIVYHGNGKITCERSTIQAKKVSLLAGGSGVTPMLQCVRAALSDPKDRTRWSMIFSNKTIDDIICRDVLDQLEKAHPERFRVWYTVSSPEKGDERMKDWKYGIGRIDEHSMRDHLFAPSSDSLALVCGPPPMVEACLGNLMKFGYDDESVFEF